VKPSQLDAMLAESLLDLEDATELGAVLAPLAELAEVAPEPSAELLALFGQEAPPATSYAEPGRVLSFRPTPRVRRAVAGAVVLALSGVGATGLSAAANTLPGPWQHHVSDFSHHYLPFDFPEPPRSRPHVRHPSDAAKAPHRHARSSDGEELGTRSPDAASRSLRLDRDAHASNAAQRPPFRSSHPRPSSAITSDATTSDPTTRPAPQQSAAPGEAASPRPAEPPHASMAVAQPSTGKHANKHETDGQGADGQGAAGDGSEKNAGKGQGKDAGKAPGKDTGNGQGKDTGKGQGKDPSKGAKPDRGVRPTPGLPKDAPKSLPPVTPGSGVGVGDPGKDAPSGGVGSGSDQVDVPSAPDASSRVTQDVPPSVKGDVSDL
jgi:hypothetical protein